MDEGELNIQIKVYLKKMEPYEAKEITKAFTIWCDENKKFPHYSEILNIIKRNHKVKGPQDQLFIAPPKKTKPTDEEKKQVTIQVRDIKKILNGG